MRRPMIGLALALAAALVASPVAAHPPGSQVISTSGWFILTPVNSLNYSFHAYLSSLGLPIGPGDTLKFTWASNGGVGPPAYFEIHSHPTTTGYVQFYNDTGDRDDASWSVPGSDAYMVLWANENSVNINVSYTFQLIPPPPELWPFAVLGVVVGGTVIVLWILSKRRGEPPEEK